MGQMRKEAVMMTIIDIHVLTGYGNLKAMVHAKVGPIVLRSIKLLEDDQGHRYLGMPCKKRGDVWEDIFTIDQDIKNELLNQVEPIYDYLKREERGA